MEMDPLFEEDLRDQGLRSFDDFMILEGGRPTSQHKSRETLPVSISVDGRDRVLPGSPPA